MSRLYTHTVVLASFIWRKDRVKILIWIIAITLSTILIAAMLPTLYSSELERQMMAETMKNPAVTFMLGPGYGLDNYTDGAMMAHFMLAFTSVAVGIMSILLTTKNTREDEEEGRIEMLRSLPVGFLAPFAATILIAVITNILLALVVGFGLYSLGLESMDLTGSLLYGASLGAIGICFTAITGLFAQLTTNARSTIGYSFAFLILAYLVRGIGDIENEFLSLISPLGLILRTEVYVNNYWWPVVVTLGVSIVFFALALYLNSIRDLNAGFIPTRPGRKHASRLLLSSLGLPWRLQQTMLIAWIIGMFVLGVSYGSVLGDLEGFLQSSEMIQQMIPVAEGFTLTERFIAMLIIILSIIGAIPVLICILKLWSEEKRGRTEQLFAGSVSRNKMLGSYTIIAVIDAPLMQLASCLGFWLAASFVMEDTISLHTLLKAGFAHLPAIWLKVGLAVLLIGFAPKLTGLTWLYLGYSFFVIYLGDLLQLPEGMANLTPFGHIPQVPIEEVNFLKTAVLILIAAVLITTGFIGYNRRDLIQGV